MAATRHFEAAVLRLAGIHPRENAGGAGRGHEHRPGEDKVHPLETGPVTHEALSPVVKDVPPWIDKPFHEDFETSRLRPEMPHAPTEQAPHPVGSFDMAVNVDRLVEPEHPLGTEAEGMNEMVGVLGAESAQHNLPQIGPTIAVGVLEEENLRRVRHVGPSIAGDHRRGDVESPGEAGGLVRGAIPVGILQDQHLIIFLLPRSDHGVHRAAHQPETPRRIPVHLDRLGNHRIGGEEVDLHARGQFERS